MSPVRSKLNVRSIAPLDLWTFTIRMIGSIEAKGMNSSLFSDFGTGPKLEIVLSGFPIVDVIRHEKRCLVLFADYGHDS